MHPPDKSDLTGLLRQHFPHNPTPDQETALEQLALFFLEKPYGRVFLLNGYAGTGKTTLITAIVRALPRLGLKTVLLAPTGRAAKVMSRYAGVPAYTIHKFIYQLDKHGPGMPRFVLRPNLARYVVFIVDEASMIPEGGGDWGASDGLFSDLLRFVYSGWGCRLILSGDTAQLPPVGSDQGPALNPDLLRRQYHLEPYSVELRDVMRQQAGSNILAIATRLRQMQEDKTFSVPHIPLGPDMVWLREGHEAEDSLNDAYREAGQEETVILTRSNKRAVLFNQQIRSSVLWLDDELATGDLLMVVKNNYHWLAGSKQVSFIANGDAAELLEIYERQELYDFRFARVKLRLIDYPGEPPFESVILLDVLRTPAAALTDDQYRQLYQNVLADYRGISSEKERLQKLRENPYFQALQVKYAYAITGHKAQGGQWDHVFVEKPWMPEPTPDLDYLRWLYTALTRARQRVYLLGFTPDYFE